MRKRDGYQLAVGWKRSRFDGYRLSNSAAASHARCSGILVRSSGSSQWML